MSAAIIGIYKITSPSGRIYVGQSWDIKRRWRYHKNDHRGDGLLQRSIKKHGFDAHSFAVLASLPSWTTQDILNDLERSFIYNYKSKGVPLLNLTEGGYNAKLTNEHKEKIRQALIGHIRTELHRRNLSKSKKGTLHSEAHKQLVSERMKGRAATWLKGKKLSPEHVEKIRQASAGRTHSEEFKRSVSIRNHQNHNLIHSDESRRKRSQKMKGRTLPVEQRERMRLAQLRRWERWRGEQAA